MRERRIHACYTSGTTLANCNQFTIEKKHSDHDAMLLQVVSEILFYRCRAFSTARLYISSRIFLVIGTP